MMIPEKATEKKSKLHIVLFLNCEPVHPEPAKAAAVYFAPCSGRVTAAEFLTLVEQLDARSRRVVEERWLKVNDDGSGGMTLHQLAAEYGVSAERIRQIEVAALKKMRKALEAA